MPQGKVNDFTQAMLDMKGEIGGYRKDAAKANPIPFGMERLSRRSYAANRFKNLPPEEKRRFIEANGVDNVLKLLRGQDATPKPE